jgi:hypothetical protein
MKFKTYDWLMQFKGETIASFGAARLLRQLDGRHELIGGTARRRPRMAFAVRAPGGFFRHAPARDDGDRL